MKKEDNLVEHTFTKEDHKKGGQVSSLKKKLAQRRNCNKNCPIFDKCPFSLIGQKHGLCYMNNGKESFRNKIIKLIEGGREDFLDVVRDTIADMVRVADIEDDSNPKTLTQVINACEKYHNMVWGTKQNIQHSGKVDIELFKKYLENDSKR